MLMLMPTAMPVAQLECYINVLSHRPDLNENVFIMQRLQIASGNIHSSTGE